MAVIILCTGFWMASSWIKELKIICQRFVFRTVEVFSNVLFWVVYHGSGEKMPPIQNLLLLDTATAIAHKIRTRKVTSREVVETLDTIYETGH